MQVTSTQAHHPTHSLPSPSLPPTVYPATAPESQDWPIEPPHKQPHRKSKSFSKQTPSTPNSSSKTPGLPGLQEPPLTPATHSSSTRSRKSSYRSRFPVSSIRLAHIYIHISTQLHPARRERLTAPKALENENNATANGTPSLSTAACIGNPIAPNNIPMPKPAGMFKQTHSATGVCSSNKHSNPIPPADSAHPAQMAHRYRPLRPMRKPTAIEAGTMVSVSGSTARPLCRAEKPRTAW